MLGFHSTFRSVHEMQFVRKGDLHGGLVADSVAPWLRRLKKENVDTVRLLLSGVPISERDTPDELWGVATDGDRGLEIWCPTWKSRVRGHSDPSPHSVIYHSERSNRFGLFTRYDSDQAWDKLKIALSDFISVAMPTSFIEGPKHPDLAPPGHCGEHEVMATLAIEAGALAVGYSGEPGPGLEARDALWNAALRALECATEPNVVRLRAVA